MGFGLWNNTLLTFFLEAALLLGGLWLYLRATAPKAGSRLAGVAFWLDGLRTPVDESDA